MCQILPFTLPCCRRIYVEVSKLPSCPDAWPEKKCPPELCIQVRGYETEDRDSGTCWRCQAEIAGVLGEERENLRPEIDSAMIVHGLDEVGVSGRRRMAEEGGKCWYCGAAAGCQYCGGVAIEVEVVAEQGRPDGSGEKRPGDAGGRKDNAMNKRIKVEPRNNNQLQTPAFSYPDPEHPLQWPNGFPQPYNNIPFSAGYGFTEGSSMGGFGLPWAQSFLPQTHGTASVDWAAVYSENNTQIGQNYTDPTALLGQPGEPFPNNLPYQPQYLPDLSSAPDVKARVQPEVRTRPLYFTDCHNKLQVNFENHAQMDDATLAQILDTYSSQNRKVDQQLPHPELSFSAQHVAQEGGGSQQCTKVEQPLPGT
jgi:hypothetical protein